MSDLPVKPDWLRAGLKTKVGVDREASVLRGMVLAQEGPFKSAGRGEFDAEAINVIVDLANGTEKGLKSRFTHPTDSDDGLGKFLGRVRDVRAEKITVEREGRRKRVLAARGDLHFDRTALEESPGGGGKPLGVYVMDLAESDSDALSSSLVLQADQVVRLNEDGSRQTDKEGKPLPPLWRPTRLHASDVVDTGDAVDGLLSAEVVAEALSSGSLEQLSGLLRFDNVARLGSMLLNAFFSGADREVVHARCVAWLERYLSNRFGDPEPKTTPLLDQFREQIKKMNLTDQG